MHQRDPAEIIYHQHFTCLADLSAHFQEWLQTYSTRRRTDGEFMRDRMPLAVMEVHLS